MVSIFTPTSTELDFSSFPESDGAPMAESRENMIEMIFGLSYLMQVQGRTQFALGGNQFLFYNPHNGNDHLAPDVYLALDVPPGLRNSWRTWEEGKCPDVVMEITSVSTQAEDVGTKLRRYGQLGAREYYIYDPQHKVVPPLQAYRYEGEEAVPLPVAEGRVVSPLLGAELRVVGAYLRVVDARTAEPMLMTEEARIAAERAARIAAERAAAAERWARELADSRAAAAEARATEAAARVDEEARARHEADARAAEAEARARDEAEARRLADHQACQTAQALQEALARIAQLSGGG